MNAQEVIECLQYRFCQPDWSFAQELALVPGFSSRRADAVAMCNVPSGKFGCAILGFEVKVSRSDFLHEMKHPEKRAETYVGVDGLFLAVPTGLVKKEEVPADMGLIYCKDGAARIVLGPRENFKLPAQVATVKKEGGYYGTYDVLDFDRMPAVSRALAVALLRAFHEGRDKELAIWRGRQWDIRANLDRSRRELAGGFPWGFDAKTENKE